MKTHAIAILLAACLTVCGASISLLYSRDSSVHRTYEMRPVHDNSFLQLNSPHDTIAGFSCMPGGCYVLIEHR